MTGISEISQIHLAKLRFKAVFALPVASVLSVAAKAGSNCCKVSLKNTEEDDEEIEEAAVSPATANRSFQYDT